MSEPWLGGPLAGIDPLVAPMFYSFEQARQEFNACTEGLTTEQIWSKPHGMASIGFHIRHAGGAAERLCTYLRGAQLSETQVAAMKREGEGGAGREELLAEMEAALGRVEEYARGIDVETLRVARGVGRKMLPTTVIGLLVHIAEHTMRHAGQAVTGQV